MWFGHILTGLVVSSLFNFDARIILLCLFFSWLPNIDAIFVKMRFAKKGFHDGPTHSITFSIIFGLIASFFSLEYGTIAFLCYFLHLLCDLPTDTGISIFYPLTKKRYSLNLWKETGFWGNKSILGYYKQKWAKILEGLVIIILILIIAIKISH